MVGMVNPVVPSPAPSECYPSCFFGLVQVEQMIVELERDPRHRVPQHNKTGEAAGLRLLGVGELAPGRPSCDLLAVGGLVAGTAACDLLGVGGLVAETLSGLAIMAPGGFDVPPMNTMTTTTDKTTISRPATMITPQPQGGIAPMEILFPAGWP